MLHVARWRIALVVVVTVLGLVFAMPNVLTPDQRAALPGFMPKNAMSLGLDLQGGSHLLLEADRQSYYTEKYKNLADDMRRVLREKPALGYTGLGSDRTAARVRLTNPADLQEATKRLRTIVPAVPQTSRFATGAVAFNIQTTPDGLITIAYTEEAAEAGIRDAVQRSMEVVRRRIDALGTRETSIQRQGTDRILVQVPGESDPERLKNLIGQTAVLTFHMVDSSVTPSDAAADRVPPGREALPDDSGFPIVIESRALVSGEDLIRAEPSFDQMNQPVVTFQFNNRGARAFGRATQANIGQRFAVVLDGKVITAPVIRSAILGGSGQIEGGFTVESASDLAALLRAGALPLKLNVAEQRTVGPELGADAVRAGFLACLIAGIMVIAFMGLTYGFFGLISIVALVVNLILTVAFMSAIGAALTLPGIAGLVLTMGMAVDANVLIYERMREEQAAGRGPVLTIEAGFSRAIATIIDSNLTAVLAALIMFQFGGGPVRGFAITLTVGILTSVFTSVLISQVLIGWWFRAVRPKSIPV